MRDSSNVKRESLDSSALQSAICYLLSAICSLRSRLPSSSEINTSSTRGLVRLISVTGMPTSVKAVARRVADAAQHRLSAAVHDIVHRQLLTARVLRSVVERQEWGDTAQ